MICRLRKSAKTAHDFAHTRETFEAAKTALTYTSGIQAAQSQTLPRL
jgi:hypothetical protein